MDTESLLKLFNAHKVKYVIIGATAFPIHMKQAAGRAKDKEDLKYLNKIIKNQTKSRPSGI